MVELVDYARRESYLIAVGGVARRRGGDYLALRQLALDGLGYGGERVGSARYAHCSVDV